MRRIALHTVLLFLTLGFVLHSSTALASGGMVGKQASAFQVKLLAGGEFDLSEYLGKKVILLDFWSIYCVSCVQEMPYLVNIQNKYPDELLIVGVDLDSFGTKRVKRFIKKLKFKIPYPIVVDKRRKVAGLYSVSVLPTTIIIDKEGKVTYFHVGFKPDDAKEIEAQVRKAAGLE